MDKIIVCENCGHKYDVMPRFGFCMTCLKDKFKEQEFVEKVLNTTYVTGNKLDIENYAIPKLKRSDCIIHNTEVCNGLVYRLGRMIREASWSQLGPHELASKIIYKEFLEINNLYKKVR